MKEYIKVLKNLEVLHSFDVAYTNRLTSRDHYGITETPETHFISNVLLAGVLHHKCDLWELLTKLCETRKVKDNPFVKAGN